MATEVESLRDVFDRGINLHHEIESSDEPSSSDKFQDKISSAKKCFVRATEMINSLGLFSTNEQLEEVPTSEIRYFLLAAFLGDLHMRQIDPDRLTNINTAKVYFVDFLRRCRDYGLTSEDVTSERCAETNSGAASLQKLAVTRQEKIRRYKAQKEQEHRIKVLKGLLDSNKVEGDQVQRDYSIALVKLWINKAVEQLSLIEDEVEILKHMQKMSMGKVPEKQKQEAPPKHMKPIVITRETIKSKVFGAGYPSLPTMSQEEYLEKEIRQGKIVLEYDQKTESKEGTSSECKDSDEDAEENVDDPEKLKKAREWDDYRDDHRRGCGNRENMG